MTSITETTQAKVVSERDRRRARRLILAALDCLLSNWSFDITFINQRDLSPHHLLRNGEIAGSAVVDFAAALAQEFPEAA